jgi:hypothetical protein
MTRLAKMYQKQKMLWMNHKNLAKIYIIETEIVVLSLAARVIERKGVEKWGESAVSYCKQI